MVTPFSLLSRVTGTTRQTPATGRCPVCQNSVRAAQPTLHLRGGIRVHRECATYRIRQTARLR